jgi:hypothetical protein
MYEYLDGNGNKYSIKKEGKISIEYIPMKPHLSSSGVYNGGDYTKKLISDQEWNKLTSILNEAIRERENHIENRIKNSGMVIIQEKNKKETYIIAPNSKKLLEIEILLRDILKK